MNKEYKKKYLKYKEKYIVLQTAGSEDMKGSESIKFEKIEWVSNKIKYTYEGFTLKNKRHGQGKLTSDFSTYNEWGELLIPDFSTYNGEWKDDKMHGWGQLTDNLYTYNGEWKDNKMHGLGEATSDFSTYIGEWKDDKMHGFGKMEEGSSIYVGEWKDDKKNGKGKMNKGREKEVYIGQWEEDMKKGNGKMTKTVNDVKSEYIGKWNNDKESELGISRIKSRTTKTLIKVRKRENNRLSVPREDDVYIYDDNKRTVRDNLDIIEAEVKRIEEEVKRIEEEVNLFAIVFSNIKNIMSATDEQQIIQNLQNLETFEIEKDHLNKIKRYATIKKQNSNLWTQNVAKAYGIFLKGQQEKQKEKLHDATPS